MEGKKFGAQSTARVPRQSPPEGYVLFRILGHVSQVGDVIGKDGRVIRQLKESTNSQIWVEKAPLDSLYRVITIIADVGSTSRVKLGVIVNNASNRKKEEVQEQEVEVSRAQGALIRVFEALNVRFGTSSTVSSRLLMEACHVVTVIGKGGELMEMIRKETGCNVEICQYNLPSCADPDDVMVKIEGNVFAVKKVLVSISSRLQACQSIFKKKMVGNPHNMQTNVVPREALYRASNVFQGDISVSRLKHRELDPLESLHRNLSQPRKDSEDNKQQVVLKILCSKERIGRVIGNGRATIRDLQSETGAFITLGSNRLDCDEGLFTITASEDPNAKNSPSQRALVLVFSKMYENTTAKVLDSGLTSSITARLVVRSNQINCLMGEEGHIKSTIQQRTGAFITVLNVEQNPKCVSENNQIVQISGAFPNVKEAINQVTSMLREDLINQSFQMGSHFPVNYFNPCIRPEDSFPNWFSPTTGYAPNFGQVSFPLWASPPPAAPRNVNDGSGGLSSTRDRNKIVQYRVSEHDVSSVFGYGKDGHNRLQKSLREISGAFVSLLEPYPGRMMDMTICISGTPDQIQAAENRLHAFFPQIKQGG
ncbi:KH domain-containing protein HEN4 [Arabidopsis lyrata subsp. lyrata]|uniref:KH domain-containing protein HEN4 n=1 Tax=Arabidopsis lyrata subsp. lyrata TaxID=81972 RepID=UPI000A29AC25|nr:KH domain-containing protein HEN4 [Arabidopsis lyrata subsp. lyrata]|eukprot:XP_020876546.1 KH domain-containing protein HEN4 [Arabidopsis lyrata subsp. lyrata]